MATRYENQSNLDREDKAIKLWTKNMKESEVEKLGDNDIDFRVYSHNSDTYAYVEVKGRHRDIVNAFPLPIAARKIVKIHDLLKNDDDTAKAFVIWACDDGIISGNIEDLIGEAKIGGRSHREGSANDCEVMIYYKEQTPLVITMYPQ